MSAPAAPAEGAPGTAESRGRALAQELRDLEARLRQGGGPKRIEKQHADGKLTARERIGLLIDPRTRQAFLHTRYHTLLDAQRFAALEQRFQERTAALHQEIAERQRLEREAQQVQHFALLGQLAAGVSHEIRNPLSAVVLHVDLLSEELQQPTPDSPGIVAEALAEHLNRFSTGSNRS